MKIIQFICAFLITVNVSFGDSFVPSPWTAAGSTGVVDEYDKDEVRFHSSYATIKTDGKYNGNDSVTLRYNVVASDAIDANDIYADSILFKVRYKDNGDNSRVLIKLRRYNINNGSSADMITIDSNDYASSSSFQTIETDNGCKSEIFDFEKYVYYVEVTLSRTPTIGIPLTTIGLPVIATQFGTPVVATQIGTPIIAAMSLRQEYCLF